jgi:ribosome-associated protein
MDTSAVVEHLLRGAHWSASRSSGPGGQHRDKASTRAELTIELDSLTGLEPRLVDLLARELGLEERPLRISVQEERSLARNQEIAAERLAEVVARAMSPPPPPRRPTRPSRSKREARLANKTRRGGLKRLRQQPADDA